MLLFQGLTARVLYQAPSTAVAWSVYEFFKYWLRLNDQSSKDGAADLKKYDSIEVLKPHTHNVVVAQQASN